MFKTLLAGLGMGKSAASAGSSNTHFTPYNASHANLLYNLLFCDDIDLFKRPDSASVSGLWQTLLTDPPDTVALQQIALNADQESRVRALAYNRLRAVGHTVPGRQLLGVIVEVPLNQGLDTLAAYADGRVRYLNQSGKVAVFESPSADVAALAKDLVRVSERVVNAIGPWHKARLPPPRTGNVRLTFLVSDGLYFGEGPFEALQKDAMGGAVLAKAAQLLNAVVEAGTK